MSERDKELLRMVGMSEQQAERNAAQAESESEPDGLTGRVYYGLHLEQPDEEMVTVSVRLPKATVDSLDQQARPGRTIGQDVCPACAGMIQPPTTITEYAILLSATQKKDGVRTVWSTTNKPGPNK